MSTLVVIAKAPVPGLVKTRLTPPLTPDQAAAVAEAALVDTLAAVLATPADRRLLVLAGEPGPWLPAGFEVVPQCAGGLDLRLAAAFAGCSGPTLLVGMDTPQITPALLTVDWAAANAWIGPATDGGFWAIGLREPDPTVFPGVPMSVPETGVVQRARLIAAGLSVRDLPTLTDIDTIEDLAAVTRDSVDTYCAGVARALLGDEVYA
jgi:glycosyltransferase A (GT-A) superfamily protein (DUF2064 family)